MSPFIFQGHAFFIRIIFMENEPQRPKTLRKYFKNLQTEIPELQFIKMLIFPRAP